MKFLLFSIIVEFRTSYGSNLLYVQFKSKCIMKQQVELFKIFFNLGFLMNSRGIEVSIRFNSLNSRSEVLRRSLIPSGITKWYLQMEKRLSLFFAQTTNRQSLAGQIKRKTLNQFFHANQAKDLKYKKYLYNTILKRV